jgi:Sec-independent protein translocase protein TatA
MMNFGPIKLLFTAVAALLILGPKRLPAAVRSLGRALGELRRASTEVTEELKAGFDLGPEDPRGGPAPTLPGPRAVFPPTSPPTSTPPSSAGPPEEELRPGPR